MSDKLKPGSYIDTQGMAGPADPNAKSTGPVEYKPSTVKPRRLFTEEYVKEMKILINEVLDERQGKFNYTSFFDTEKFKHLVTEEEPEYRPSKGGTWTENDGSTGECPPPPKYNPAYYQ